ncbi:MAG: hypothetical protein ACI9G5_001680 [Paracoccaceae bacterium]
MYLRYLESAPQAEALLLRNEQCWRVELFVLRNNDDGYSLVALSGREQAQAEREKTQGPYQTRAQALAARSAVAAQLQDSGFTIDEMTSTLWRLQAQRKIKELRALREHNSPDCRFDPDDVY